MFLPCAIPLLLLVWSDAPAEGNAPVLELSRAVEIALDGNPDVRRRREVVEEARQGRREALAEALPELTLEARTFRSRDPGILLSPNFQDLPEQSDGGFSLDLFRPIPVTQYDYSLLLEQQIFAWGRVPAARRAAGVALDTVNLDVDEVELEVARRVTEAYYDLELAQRRLEVLDAERESREAQLKQASDMLEVGAATRLDVLQTEVELANLKPRMFDARNESDRARSRLNEAMGRPVRAEARLRGPRAGAEPEPPGLETLLAMAVSDRPGLKRFLADRQVLELRAAVLRSDVRPRVDLSGSYGAVSLETQDLTDSDFRSWRVGLTASWTFFDGFRTAAAVGQLHSRMRQSEQEEAAFCLALARELETALGDWRQAFATAAASSQTVARAEEARRVAQESYTWGAATSLDVLVADRSLREAELNLAQADHDQAVALAQIKYLVGRRADRPLGAVHLEAPRTLSWAEASPCAMMQSMENRP